jgi:hypothetical protein
VDGRDGASGLVDGRHGPRQRVGHLALLLSPADENAILELSWRERKEMIKYMREKKENEARRGRASRPWMTQHPTTISDPPSL